MTATNRFGSGVTGGPPDLPHHLSGGVFPDMFDLPAACPHNQDAGA
jgi:hypothetical protein